MLRRYIIQVFLILHGASFPAVEFPLDSASGNAAWAVSPSNGSFSAPASVPGCVHLDLLRAGLIGEPNDGWNVEAQLWIPSENFSFAATFTPPAALAAAAHVRLVLAGVDTAAAVWLNGVALASLANMFRTHVLALPAGALRAGAPNALRVDFTGAVPASRARQAACEAASRPCAFANCTCPAPWPGPAPRPLLINAYLRKPQMDFSWDFAPSTGTAGLRAAPVLLGFASAALREGAVVSTALVGGAAWDVNITVRIEGDAGGTLAASVGGVPGAAAAARVAPAPRAAGGAEVTVRLSFPDAPAVRRWWPRGYGDAALYPLSIVFNSSAGEVSVHPPLQVRAAPGARRGQEREQAVRLCELTPPPPPPPSMRARGSCRLASA
jgi:beta-mannosidase